MKRKLVFLFACLVAVVLSGCASAPGAQFSGLAPAAPDQGDVYLYRSSAVYAVAQSFSVQVDGTTFGDLYNASYLHLRLQPGRHVLKVAPGGLAKVSELEVGVEAGKAAFYQYDFVTGPLANFFFAGSSIQPRESESALPELRQLRAAR